MSSDTGENDAVEYFVSEFLKRSDRDRRARILRKCTNYILILITHVNLKKGRNITKNIGKFPKETNNIGKFPNK